jgi:HD superfamily phosphohydrolase YqeK
VRDVKCLPTGSKTEDVTLHPIVTAAAEGELPSWTVAGPTRRAHMRRVSEMLGQWAEQSGLDRADTLRWRAAGYLHDALRDEHPSTLRSRVPPAERSLPGPLLHGPAAAERLRIDGVLDGELLLAVAWHTIGDPRFGLLGQALYVADFLEPGRAYLPEWRAERRARMPAEVDHVVVEVARARLTRGLEREAPLLPRSVAFWNAVTERAA